MKNGYHILKINKELKNSTSTMPASPDKIPDIYRDIAKVVGKKPILLDGVSTKISTTTYAQKSPAYAVVKSISSSLIEIDIAQIVGYTKAMTLEITSTNDVWVKYTA